MHPSSNADRADALRENHHLLAAHAVRLRQMPDEAIDVMHDGGETRRVAPFARRAAMTARVPSEDGHVADCQRFDDVLHAAGMLMPAMKDDERFFRRPLGNPGPIEKRRAVGQFDGVFGWNEIGDGRRRGKSGCAHVRHSSGVALGMSPSLV